jgi:hypothetical protein
MFWEHATIQQLMRLVTRDPHRPKPGRTSPTITAGDRFGCCPRCQTFVRIGPVDRVGSEVPCPSCLKPIRELEPLWP